MSEQELLSYRALTNDTKGDLCRRVSESVRRDGYHLHGDAIAFCNTHGTMLFMQTTVRSKDLVYSGTQPREIHLEEGYTDRAFCERVSKLLAKGWLLWGPPSVYDNTDGMCLMQALVKA